MEAFWAQYKDVLLSAALFNGFAVVGFVIAYFIEFRPLVKRKKEKDDELAKVALERAWSSMKIFIILFLALQTVISILIANMVDVLSTKVYVSYVYLPSFVVSYPVFLFFRRNYYKKMKKVVITTNTDILIDFNYRILNRILNWKVELLTMIGLYACNILYFDYNTAVFILSPVLLMIYFSVRTGKYFVKDRFAYWYKGLFYCNIFYQLVKLFAMWDEYTEIRVDTTLSAKLLLISTVLIIALQIGLCLVNFPKVRKALRTQLNGNAQEPSTA